MSVFVHERVLTPAEAAWCEVLRRPDGSFPTESTVKRWIRRGCYGVRLEGRRVGRQWLTTVEACERFSVRLAAATSRGGVA